MKRTKFLLIGSVSASVLLVSSLLVACATADIARPQAGSAPDSTTQAESMSAGASASASENRPDSSTRAGSTSESAASQNQSQSNHPPSSSSRPPAVPSSQAPPAFSSQAPSSQVEPAPQQTPVQQPANPAPPPAQPQPEPPPPVPEPSPPPPAPSVSIDACLSAAAGWAAGNNMAVNDGLFIGGAGYENPIDTNGKADAQVTEHLLYQLGLIHGQLVAMPEFDPGTSYPCYKFVVDGSLIYVLYG